RGVDFGPLQFPALIGEEAAAPFDVVASVGLEQPSIRQRAQRRLEVKRSERLGVRWVRDLDRALALLMPLRAFECCIIGASPIGDWVRERLMTVARGTPIDIRIRKIVVRKIFLMDDDLHYTPLGCGTEGVSPHLSVLRACRGV